MRFPGDPGRSRRRLRTVGGPESGGFTTAFDIAACQSLRLSTGRFGRTLSRGPLRTCRGLPYVETTLQQCAATFMPSSSRSLLPQHRLELKYTNSSRSSLIPFHSSGDVWLPSMRTVRGESLAMLVPSSRTVFLVLSSLSIATTIVRALPWSPFSLSTYQSQWVSMIPI